MSAVAQEPRTEKPRVWRLPFNRFVTFIKPWLNLVAGAIAAWLIAKANVLGVPGLDEENTATWIAGALAWLLTQGALQIGDLQWVKGHHITIAADAQVTAAALAPVPEGQASADLTGSVHDEEAEAASPDVSDEQEFAEQPPPPDDSNMPVQPGPA